MWGNLVSLRGLGLRDPGSNPGIPINKMKIGIISDTHDRIDNLHKAITLLQVRGVQILIHCGDLCAPFMIDEHSLNLRISRWSQNQ